MNYSPNPFKALNADWMAIHTVTRFIEQVDPDFEWRGPGWYVADDAQPASDTMFVVALSSEEETEDSHGRRYRFYVYNNRDPRSLAKEEFRGIIGASLNEE